MFTTRILWTIAILTLMLILFTTGCAQTAPETTPPTAPGKAWMDYDLTNVTTGETFHISDFKGKTILLESFAVWCPTCLAQQREMSKIMESEGEDIVHISLDTDPNEDAAKVKDHVERNNLNWYFAVAPRELTEALIDEFGLEVVSAPRAPVVLICEDGSARLLRGGLKSADDILGEVEKDCQ